MNNSTTDIKNAELELSLIRKIMEDSRKAVYDTSMQGTFWTLVMAPAILINYLMFVLNTGLMYSGFLWLAAVLIGCIGSVVIAKKEKRVIKVKTFAGKILASIGIAAGGANLIFAIASGFIGAFKPLYIVPVDSVVLGMAFYLVGVIQQIKTLKFFALLWWAGAVFFFFFPSIHCLLFLALMLIIMVLLPKIEGIKKTNHQDKFYPGRDVDSSTPADFELSVIKKIMHDSRKAVIDNGWHYIYWGILVTVILIVNYIMVLRNVSMNSQGMLWFISMISASVIEQIITKKFQKEEKERNFSGKLLATLWSVSGLCMFILAFAGSISGAYNPIFIFPVLSSMLGAAYFISGTIQQVKWLKLLAAGWWAGSLTLFLYPGINSMLIFAGMLVLLQTLPGFILYRKWKVSLSERN